VNAFEREIRAEMMDRRLAGASLKDQIEYWGGRDDWNVPHIYKSTLYDLLQVYGIDPEART